MPNNVQRAAKWSDATLAIGGAHEHLNHVMMGRVRALDMSPRSYGGLFGGGCGERKSLEAGLLSADLLFPPTRSRLRSSSPSLPFYHPPVSPGLVPAVVHIPSLKSSTSSAYSQWLLRRFPGKKVSTGPTSRLVSASVPSASGCNNQIAEPVVRTRCHYEHGNA